MKQLLYGLCLLALVCAPPLSAAESRPVGVVTILDGQARVLRGTAWYALVPGARILDADLVDVAERAAAQLEWQDGSALAAVGPAQIYVASYPAAGAKQAGGPELALAHGWFKAAMKGPPGLTLRSPDALVSGPNAIFVVHLGDDTLDLFVEKGPVRLAEPGKGRTPGPSVDAKSDEFWVRAAGKDFTRAAHMPHAFVGAMPKTFTDPLPSLAARFRNAKPPALEQVGEVVYAEAEPWLSGPYRRAFVRRFTPRLHDAAFRHAVDANIRAYPEWDRILHPEKYDPERYGSKR